MNPAQSGDRLRLAGLRSRLAGPFDLSVEAGECIAITGASGSGKSLFLRMIADLDPAQGQVWLDGRPRAGFPAPEWRRQVVYNAAEPGWWSDQVAAHFSAVAAAFARGAAPRIGLAPELLDAQVAAAVHRRAAAARVCCARWRWTRRCCCLTSRPARSTRTAPARVEAVLRERLAAGVAIVMVTHSPAQAERLGRRRFRMQDGGLVAA